MNYDGCPVYIFFADYGKTRWRNGNKKDDSIKVRVRNGTMSYWAARDECLDYDELYLKVRFDNGDGKGLRHLDPDQRITATPRALVAEVAKTADSVKAGGIRPLNSTT